MSAYDPGAVAAYDQAIAKLKDTDPGHSDAYYDALLLRFAWYLQHDGDMAGAPELPDDLGGESW
jgi:hypothetical protein